MTPVTFAGSFSNIRTYSIGHRAVAVEGAIEVDQLRQLSQELIQNFEVKVENFCYSYPATLVIGGNNDQVRFADVYAKQFFEERGVTFDYRA